MTGSTKFGPDLERKSEPNYDFDDAEGVRRVRFAEEIRRSWPGLTSVLSIGAFVADRLST